MASRSAQLRNLLFSTMTGGFEMKIREQLERFQHDPEWLRRYLRFIESAPPCMGQSHKHHILPKSIFPEFESFSKCPWNCKPLSHADHPIAHYHLFRALPAEPRVYTALFPDGGRGFVSCRLR
jgi:hypothetical protein